MFFQKQVISAEVAEIECEPFLLTTLLVQSTCVPSEPFCRVSLPEGSEATVGSVLAALPLEKGSVPWPSPLGCFCLAQPGERRARFNRGWVYFALVAL